MHPLTDDGRRSSARSASQAPGRAATELHVADAGSSRGWMTAARAPFPARVSARLRVPSDVRRLRLLSHECKIATSCDVYVSCRGARGAQTVKKLGTLRFESGVECGYGARELKTVHVNVKAATEIRLEFAGCHENARNVDRQIGLMALTIIGEPSEVRGGEVASVSVPTTRGTVDGAARATARAGGVEDGVDALTAEKIREVAARKEHAVDAEDYDEAKRLRDVIARLRTFGVRVKVLQEEKMRAVEAEDYDEAKRLKIEIDKMRSNGYDAAFAEASSPRATTVSPETTRPSPPSFAERTQTQTRATFSFDEAPIRSRHADAMRELAESGATVPTTERLSARSSSASEIDRTASTTTVESPRPKPIEVPKNEPSAFRADDSSAVGMSNDEVPAVASGRRVPPELEAEAKAFFEEEEAAELERASSAKKPSPREEQELPPPPPLSPSEQVTAAPIVRAFGEDVVVRLYSQAWVHRESALQAINKRLIDAWESEDGAEVLGEEPRETFHALCKTLGDRLFNDKVANVTCAAAVTLASAAKAYAEFISARDVRETVGDSISLLVDKLGDTNPRLRESIREALHAFASDAPGGVSILAHALCKPVQKLSVWRVLTGRLTLLVELVPTYGLDAPEKENSFALDQVMKFATTCFDSANGEARGMAVKVVLACVDIVGSRVRKYLPRTLKHAIKDVIETAIDENEDPYDIRGRGGGAAKSPTASGTMWAATSPKSPHARAVTPRADASGDDWRSSTTDRDDISPELSASATALEREITRRIETRGEDHPEVAAAMNDLATLFSESENFARAQTLFERALAIQETTLGAEHPETVQTLTDLAICHLDREDNNLGRPLLERALELQTNILGPEHPDVGAIRDVLASLDADGAFRED